MFFLFIYYYISILDFIKKKRKILQRKPNLTKFLEETKTNYQKESCPKKKNIVREKTLWFNKLILPQAVCIYHKLGNDCNIGSHLKCEIFESFNMSFDSVLIELLKTNLILFFWIIITHLILLLRI